MNIILTPKLLSYVDPGNTCQGDLLGKIGLINGNKGIGEQRPLP